MLAATAAGVVVVVGVVLVGEEDEGPDVEMGNIHTVGPNEALIVSGQKK